MPDDNQELDASGIGVADMTPEEIDAALAVVASEVAGESPPPTEAGDSATNGAESSANQPLEATETCASLSAEASEPTEASDAADAVPPSNSDTEAALDRIDSDLAELESLLAQTSSDGTSIPASLAQAPPPPQATATEPVESAATQATAEAKPEATETAGTETAEKNAADDAPLKKELGDTAGIDDMLLDGSDSLPKSSPGAEVTPKAESDSAAEVAEEATEIAVDPYDGSPLNVFGMVVSKVLLKPLILIDIPFARLRPRAKTAVGLAAVATFLVAVATWVIGCMR